jgi:hypothetical protein
MDCDMTNRPGFIRLNHAVLDRIYTNMGAPARDGPVTFPVYPLHKCLYTQHWTDDCYSKLCHEMRQYSPPGNNRVLCEMVWGQLPGPESTKDQRAGGRFGGILFPIKFVLMVKNLVLLTFTRTWV